MSLFTTMNSIFSRRSRSLLATSSSSVSATASSSLAASSSVLPHLLLQSSSSSIFSPFPLGSLQQIRTATKRGGGSSKNGRSSAGRRLGVKKFTDQFVNPGEVIVRQRGGGFRGGQGVGQGKDFTLYALEPGFVKFYSSPIPFPHVVVPAAPSSAPSSAILEDISSSSSSAVSSSPASSTSAPTTASPSPVKRPRAFHQYIGITRTRDEKLPRDELSRGRDRRFWKIERSA